ncbi:hypothetical protein LJC07_08080 [Christensenellaceae bacterium OttesenSCG-928-L17]|nr:hypothetical protein [Christensenellaceae bacterium OttesenSCG-928-L17]
MKNITIPGVFPGVIALMLAFTAIRAHAGYKKTKDKKFRTSKYLCIVGAVLFAVLAVFQLINA